MYRPSSEKATDSAQLVCPVNGPATASPVAATTQIVQSFEAEPEAMRRPSGDNAIEVIGEACPVGPTKAVLSWHPTRESCNHPRLIRRAVRPSRTRQR
jgi:hypothetical protein